ncbi:hypothetical protein [Nocardioides marmorisolisilvae]|uniref:Ig-like domain repeat protein n=1 Tax=Nocardioides marmorisolisilvae TaxID=1542737 RepID=A0A3N0DZ39_9ACTN|nr:hypothetical protein [Nocardioides marmorisolisilvae]RNL80874.1 hypothetical protein EFL95_00340 [Nocardioides marmorisolisilvae]
MSVRNLARAVVGAFIIATAFVAAPANAYSLPIVSALDTNTIGHVKGTVTSDAPYVLVWAPGHYDHYFATADGVASFDLETWGLTTSYVEAWPCSQPTESSCTSFNTASYFTASDVTPTITWPSDLKIGPGDAFPVTVSDPQGGGVLVAFWQEVQYLDRNGTTQLDLGDGDGYIDVYRCDSEARLECRNFDSSTRVSLGVHKSTKAEVSASPASTFPGYVSTRQTSTQLRLQTHRPVGLPYTLDWHLEKNGVPVPGTGGEVVDTLNSDGETTFSATADGLADGTYTVAGNLTVHDPDYGDLPGPLTGGTVIVDRKPASFTSVAQTASRIYPNIGAHGLDDSARFTFKGMYGGRTTEMYSASDVLVRRGNLSQSTTTPTTWSGYVTARDNSQKLLPDGFYTVYLVDTAGNRKLAGSVYVDHRKLVARTYTKTVSATSTLVDEYVGKCSTLKHGVRGWYGSLGYYANTKCGTQTSAASEVHTIHELKMPTGAYYKTIELYTYGGAAKSRPGSQAVMLYLTPRGHLYDKGTASARLGTHPGYTSNAETYLWSGHYFVWAVATAFNHQYDVKNFTVELDYYVLG